MRLKDLNSPRKIIFWWQNQSAKPLHNTNVERVCNYCAIIHVAINDIFGVFPLSYRQIELLYFGNDNDVIGDFTK